MTSETVMVRGEAHNTKIFGTYFLSEPAIMNENYKRILCHYDIPEMLNLPGSPTVSIMALLEIRLFMSDGTGYRTYTPLDWERRSDTVARNVNRFDFFRFVNMGLCKNLSFFRYNQSPV